MKYQISPEQYAEIVAAKKANRDKQIDARLNVLLLRYEGKGLVEIAKETGFHRQSESHRQGISRQQPLKQKKRYQGLYIPGTAFFRIQTIKWSSLDGEHIPAAAAERLQRGVRLPPV